MILGFEKKQDDEAFSSLIYELMQAVMNNDITIESFLHTYTDAVKQRKGEGEFPFIGAQNKINNLIWLLGTCF
jgi:hypothetical protein